MPHDDAVGTLEMAAPTGHGRVFGTGLRVRLGDATAGGRLRLDAVVRYLQDVANDDSRDAGVVGADLHNWVVRRTVIDVTRFPLYLDQLDLSTWCSGVGSHWAERRTRVTGADGTSCLEAVALWVHVDTETMSPRRLSPGVAALWSEASSGRRVRAKLVLDPALADSVAPVVTAHWPTRRTDFDALGHMNNAATWEIVEERMASRRDLRAGSRFVVEHVGAIEAGDTVTWSVHTGGESEVIRVVVDDEIKLMCWMGPVPRT